MSRRPSGSTRRTTDSGFLFGGSSHSKSRSSPLLSIGLVLLGGGILILLARGGSGLFGSKRSVVSKIEGDYLCAGEAIRAIPVLKKAYGDSTHKVLHIGPETCSVVSKMLAEEETEAWGVEPYDMEDADRQCKALVRKGIVRVADIKFPLPYRPKSFDLVVVTDALDYLSPKYLNKTLPDLARISSDGVIIFTGSPDQQRPKVAELSKFGKPAKMRSKTWWSKFFLEVNMEENGPVIKKFEQASKKMTFEPSCQIFHLKPYN